MATIRCGMLAASALCALTTAQAQTAQPPALPAVTVTAPAPEAAQVGGFGDIPLAKTPLQASIYDSQSLKDGGAERLADLTRLDAAVGDAYNSIGYWDFLSVRGYTLDNRFNYRRDGLPINAETRIPLDNKQRIEILKGLSGMQAGTSAPGGLVNYVVKRPSKEALREVFVRWQDSGSLLGALDLSQRFGEQQAFGLRLNAAHEDLKPKLSAADGYRKLFALAGDWRPAAGTLLEAEVETSRQSQPSQPGFSLLGSRVPEPVNPRLNLNNQAWSLPVVFDGNSASLRYTQALAGDWRASAHLATQRLRTDDRVAFPFGCTAEGNFDRYCSDGNFDFYDFRSEGERRRSEAFELALHGRLQTAALQHNLSAGVLRSEFQSRLQRQAFNFVGAGGVDGGAVVPPDPTLTDENTNRDESSTELFVRDAVWVTDSFGLWAGLRHTALHRASVRTDGSRPTDYSQSFVTPWLAATLQIDPAHLLYSSWGRGSESEVAPNRARYTNAGQALPVLRSRQIELGIKAQRERFDWSLAAFDIGRPAFADFGICDDTDNSCTRQADGTARHRGIEANLSWHSGRWLLQGASQWLHAQRRGSQDASVNGLRPTNVPNFSTRLFGSYAIAAWPGLRLGGAVRHESDRIVLPDNSRRIGGYAVADISARHEQRLASGATLSWRAGIDNLFDRRAWQESPYQFSHVYLFPLEARTARVSLQASW